MWVEVIEFCHSQPKNLTIVCFLKILQISCQAECKFFLQDPIGCQGDEVKCIVYVSGLS